MQKTLKYPVFYERPLNKHTIFKKLQKKRKRIESSDRLVTSK